jgi:hypothetical protein
VAGAKVTGLAAPTGPSDAVSAGHASANYSASAVSPQLDVGGSSALKGLTYLFLQTYVNKILAGAGITISPVAGTGIVRISATGVGVGNFIFGEQVAGGPLSWLLGNVPAVDANGNPAVQLFSGTAAIWRGGGLDYTLPPSSKAITTNYAITGGTLWANYLLP